MTDAKNNGMTLVLVNSNRRLTLQDNAHQTIVYQQGFKVWMPTFQVAPLVREGVVTVIDPQPSTFGPVT